ncbi:MAG: hypothetical protein OEZ06_24390 [Myxococcales bacterium]|nr:hypothetical protein [Myxococcales bacterium]
MTSVVRLTALLVAVAIWGHPEVAGAQKPVVRNCTAADLDAIASLIGLVIKEQAPTDGTWNPALQRLHTDHSLCITDIYRLTQWRMQEHRLFTNDDLRAVDMMVGRIAGSLKHTKPILGPDLADGKSAHRAAKPLRDQQLTEPQIRTLLEPALGLHVRRCSAREIYLAREHTSISRAWGTAQAQASTFGTRVPPELDQNYRDSTAAYFKGCADGGRDQTCGAIEREVANLKRQHSNTCLSSQAQSKCNALTKRVTSAEQRLRHCRGY